MEKTKKKKAGVLSVVCYILAALFFLYGVYMVIYAVDYIQSYESTGLIDTQNVIQYVVTSSASYLGFAVLLFAAGYAIHLLKNLPALMGTITKEVAEYPANKAFEPAAEMPSEPEMTEAPVPEPTESDIVEKPEFVAVEEPVAEPELAVEPEPAPAEELPAKETPDAFEESHVPEIGDTSSALTFHELIIDPTEDSEEEAPSEEEEEFVEEISLEEPEDTEASEEPEPNKPIEKISSSMIRDIFEHK